MKVTEKIKIGFMEYENLIGVAITDKISIYNCDCMELLKQTPDNYYSLALVDPPYGIERGGQTETFTKNPKHKRKAHKQKNWDNEIPNAEYFKELFRVSKNQIIWGANYFVEHLDKGTMGWIFWFKGQECLSMSAVSGLWLINQII